MEPPRAAWISFSSASLGRPLIAKSRGESSLARQVPMSSPRVCWITGRAVRGAVPFWLFRNMPRGDADIAGSAERSFPRSRRKSFRYGWCSATEKCNDFNLSKWRGAWHAASLVRAKKFGSLRPGTPTRVRTVDASSQSLPTSLASVLGRGRLVVRSPSRWDRDGYRVHNRSVTTSQRRGSALPFPMAQRGRRPTE